MSCKAPRGCPKSIAEDLNGIYETIINISRLSLLGSHLKFSITPATLDLHCLPSNFRSTHLTRLGKKRGTAFPPYKTTIIMKASLYLVPALTSAVWSLKTDVEFHPEYNEVDIGEGLYSCDDYMKLYDQVKDDCLSIGCSVTNEVCDEQACAAIDGTTNQGVEDKFKDYLDQLGTVVEGSCKEEEYEDYNCSPGGICSTVPRVRVQIPSFMGTSTAGDDGSFVANYKVTFSKNGQDSSCETITTLISAGLGGLPGGSLLGATSLACS